MSMMSMEEQLREYRALRRRKQLEEKAKAELELEKEDKPSTSSLLIQPEINVDETDDGRKLESFDKTTQESWRYSFIKWTVYFIIWLTVYIIFLKLQFGAVYFAISLLIGIYLNTRTRPRQEGELSAYSVFNENCTSIEGTLKADQIVKELMYGPGSIT